MAASLWFGRATFQALKLAVTPCKSAFTFSSKRHLLSQAYNCGEAWNKRLEDPVFSQIPLSEFAIQLRDNFDRHKTISAVDMEILANKLHEMVAGEEEFMEDLMIKFRKSPVSSSVRDSIVYVIVRSYIHSNLADRLVPLMQARSQTGIFPDPITFSLLLDHFIETKDFANAAQVAYEVMLQEDFSHPISRLLSLYASVHHLESVSLDDIAPEEIKDPQGEEDWIPVGYIRYPVYDDHFDIKSQQYLLGKTLYSLGKEIGTSTLGYSLQVTGLALYHKFGPCLQLLTEIANSGDCSLVQNSLTYVEESLEKAQTKDPEKPDKETGLLRMDDEIYKLLPTQQEKEAFQAQLQQLRQALLDKGKVVEDTLSALTETLVTAELPQHEAADIEVQVRRLEEWRQERQTLLQEQLFEFEKRQKVEEIENTLKELQEKEEMIRFFELNNQIRLAQSKKTPKEKVEKEEDEEVLGARRMKRRK